MNENTTSDLEKNYKRNYFSLLCESLLYTFAYSLFSVTHVIPEYVSKLTDSSWALSLVSVLYYCPVYLASIIGCYYSLNSSSPKKVCVTICISQRIGLFCIALSSLFIGRASSSVCLLVFFMAYTVYNIADGMSMPVYYDMISTMIHKNIGQFFGTYNMIGSVAGIVASLLLSYLYRVRPYPQNYQAMFFIGFLFAIGSSLMIIFGCRESETAVKERVSFRFSQFPSLFKTCLGKPSFRRYTVVFLLLTAADFSVPFYIIRLEQDHPVPENYLGIMSMVSLFSGIAANWFLGIIADKYGVFRMILISCVFGAAASVLVILNPGGWFIYATYILISFAYCGNALSNTIACSVLARGENSTVYTAASKLSAAPVTILVSVLGSILSNRSSLSSVFIISLSAYLLAFSLSIMSDRQKNIG